MDGQGKTHKSLSTYIFSSEQERGMIVTDFPFHQSTARRTHVNRQEVLHRLLAGDLDFHGRRDGSPLHTLHPFPAKYPPQLPRLFIQALTLPGEVVLDPMMGSGTTLLEAQRLNRIALGADIDPLALQLTAAKLNPPPLSAWNQAYIRVAQQAAKLLEEGNIVEAALKRFDKATQSFVNYWFLPSTQRELMALTLAIQAEKQVTTRRFLRILFSSLIIAKSGSVAQARDLSHTRPHRVPKSPKAAIDLFLQKGKRTARLLEKVAPSASAPTLLAEADAQHLPWGNASIDLIVTSPPYAANAIDYMRAHKFTLIWWGYPIRQLGALRSEYIGGEAVRDTILEPLPAEANSAIQAIAKADAKKGRVLHRYFSEMRRVLQEMQRLLRPGGIAVVVVGDSTMRGYATQTPISLAAIGEQIGLHCVGIGERRLDRNRRMMPARHGRASTLIEQRMHVEYVLGFQKGG